MTLEERAQRLAEEHGGAPGLTIAGLYDRIDRALRDALPGEVWVSGEVRSFNVSSRGHCYIDLVDAEGGHDAGAPVLRVVAWSSRWRTVRTTLDRLGVVFDAGLVVRVKGTVELYKPRGDISFILTELDTDALMGKVAAERARLVRALVDEGLFDRNRSLPVPRLPLRVGLVASPGTEGFRDFLGRLEGSGLAFDVRVAPTQVQGREAAASVAAALNALQGERCDVLVVVRGGGSKADLATFDLEPVARAVANSTTPVWTGIGHTGDLAVADEVANRSFITPTECGEELVRRAAEYWRTTVEAGGALVRLAASELDRAAELVERRRHGATTGARLQVDRQIGDLGHRAHALRGVTRGQLDTHRQRLATRGGALSGTARRVVGAQVGALTSRSTHLAVLPARRLAAEDLRVDGWRRLLGAFDYRRQLERGYSVTRDADGAVVRTVAGLTPGAVLVTQLADGTVASEVTTAPTEDEGTT